MWYNETMKKHKLGFTLVEVSLFLGITALLFAGITIGTQNSITQQRYTDTVDNFADFLRNVYSDVSNPRSNGSGTTDQALYGRLVTFGEEKDLNGNANTDHKIFSYDLIGKVDGELSGVSLQDMLKNLEIGVIATNEEKSGSNMVVRTFGLVGMTSEYIPKWDSDIEGTTYGQTFKGALVVVRHPQSGTINSLMLTGETIEINKELGTTSGSSVVYVGDRCASNCDIETNLKNFINRMNNKWKDFKAENVEFCVNPFGDSSRRQGVRILANARNASGVEILNLDSPENKCN